MAKRTREREDKSGSRIDTYDDSDDDSITEGYTMIKRPRPPDVPIWDRDSDGMVPLTISTRPPKQEPPTFEEILDKYEVDLTQLCKPCPRDIRVRVASKLKDWYKLGTYLPGVPYNKLEELKYDYRVNRFTAQRAEAVMDLWSDMYEEKATYIVLMKALVKCGEREIVISMIKWINEKNIATRPVRCKLEAFFNEFCELHEELISDLVQRRVSADRLLNSLTMLPDKFRREYESEIQAMLPTLKEEERIPKLFLQLNPLFHFLDYDLLDHLINKFGSVDLKAKMSKYLTDINKFMEETTIRDVIDMNYLRGVDFENSLTLKVKFDGDPKNYTLKQVDRFRTKFCNKTKLSRAIFGLLYCADAHSFFIIWCFPAVMNLVVINEVTALTRTQFFTEEHVQSVYVDRELLFPRQQQSYPRQQQSYCSIL